MAEEETGFTFVDKRRTAPEAIPAATEAQTAASISEPVMNPSGITEAGLQEADTADTGMADMGMDDEMQAPPTTYDMIGYCINLLSSQAWQKLGLLADPQTGEAQPDLDEAKLAIDAVSDLAARLDAAPETAIQPDLKRDLRTLVNDLRLNYVSQRGAGGTGA